jgi:threonine aldolase
MINLVSDTVTKPTPEMLQAMFAAEVGDDVFGEDPTVNALESKAAGMFGKEAALFCPSGTMTNQIAIKVHTRPLDELICEVGAHVYQYETAGYAFHSGVGVNLIQGTFGKINASQVAEAIKPIYDWLPKTSLVVLENTCNKGGGSFYTKAEIEPIRQLCHERGLKLHLDGARIFNALVESGDKPLETGVLFDSISICLSKGMGAPVGSLLIGDTEFIRQARRIRKVMGGGMRQAGYLAAAGIYALENHFERLKEDHRRAKEIAVALGGLSWVEHLRPVHTNILIFDVTKPHTASAIIEKLAAENIKVSAFGHRTLRMVTHLDFTDSMLEYTLRKLKSLV